ESRTIGQLIKLHYPDALLQFLGGLGDELMLTCVARELKRRSPCLKIWQVSAAAPLLMGNPDYHAVFDRSHWEMRHSNLLNRARIRFGYSYQLSGDDVWEIPSEHIISLLLKQAKILGEVELRPYVYLSAEERRTGSMAPVQICVQSIGHRTHETWMANKLWFHERWVEVVRKLKQKWPQVTVIQLGDSLDLPLPVDFDLRAKTSLRETAGLLAASRLFVGTQGFLPHLARAVDTRSVVVMGGREHAWQTGYIANIHLERYPPCAPCWAMSRCDHVRRCMQDIGVDEVLRAIECGLDEWGGELPVQTLVLP
ncbi:MAG: glycosyltransferase family 9 protein, partial [Sphingomonadales bacterium]|nr:glycosyltransferase family 9 protein [Sphingomonadales bacterium]